MTLCFSRLTFSRRRAKHLKAVGPPSGLSSGGFSLSRLCLLACVSLQGDFPPETSKGREQQLGLMLLSTARPRTDCTHPAQTAPERSPALGKPARTHSCGWEGPLQTRGCTVGSGDGGMDVVGVWGRPSEGPEFKPAEN